MYVYNVVADDESFFFTCQALDPPPFLDEASLNKNFMYQFLISGGPRVHHVTFKVCRHTHYRTRTHTAHNTQ